MPEQITDNDKVYIACILDNFGGINVRRLENGTRQPVIYMYGKRETIMQWLAEVTNTTAIALTKRYSRHNCTEHCPDRHADAESSTMRWQCTGMKATILLYNVVPFMRERKAEAEAALAIGLQAPYKSAYVEQMESIGWAVPDLDPLMDADVKWDMANAAEE